MQARMSLLALGLAASLLVLAPQAHAGAVFEIREPIPKTEADYLNVFNNATDSPGGTVTRPSGGAAAFFRESAIPMAVFTLKKCSAVSVHIHPNAAETLFVLEGAIRIHQFRGEDDTTARATDVHKGEAGYISQGAVHTVENVAEGETKFLQLFDHPQAGAVFVGPALAALPANLINSAFSADVLTGQKGNPGIIPVRGCGY